MRVYVPGALAGGCGTLGAGGGAIESRAGICVRVSPKIRVNSPAGGVNARGGGGGVEGLSLCFDGGIDEDRSNMLVTEDGEVVTLSPAPNMRSKSP